MVSFLSVCLFSKYFIAKRDKCLKIIFYYLIVCLDKIDKFSITKKDFPENMHICINKGTVTLVKGDLGLYLENFVLGQIVPVLAILSDLDTYQCTPNEVKLTVPIYDLSTRDFHGLKWIFAYIILRDDDDEVFLRTVLIKKNYLLDSYSKVIFDIEGH